MIVIVGLLIVFVCLILSLTYLLNRADATSAKYTFAQINDSIVQKDSDKIFKYLDFDKIVEGFKEDFYNYTIKRTANESGVGEELVKTFLTKDLVAKSLDPHGDLKTQFSNLIKSENNDDRKQYIQTIVDYLAKNSLGDKINSSANYTYTLSSSKGDIKFEFVVEKFSDSESHITKIKVIDGWDSLVKLLNLD